MKKRNTKTHLDLCPDLSTESEFETEPESKSYPTSWSDSCSDSCSDSSSHSHFESEPISEFDSDSSDTNHGRRQSPRTRVAIARLRYKLEKKKAAEQKKANEKKSKEKIEQKNIEQSQKKCAGKKSNGMPCINKVSEKCGNEFCNKHHNQWNLSEAKKIDSGAHLCMSYYSCDPAKPGEKAILPANYAMTSCEACLVSIREYDKNRAGKNRLEREILHKNPISTKTPETIKAGSERKIKKQEKVTKLTIPKSKTKSSKKHQRTTSLKCKGDRESDEVLIETSPTNDIETSEEIIIIEEPTKPEPTKRSNTYSTNNNNSSRRESRTIEPNNDNGHRNTSRRRSSIKKRITINIIIEDYTESEEHHSKSKKNSSKEKPSNEKK